MEILYIENLSFTYPTETQKALDSINLTINAGEFAVIMGETGCGKSTLLRLMKEEIAPAGKREGKIIFCTGNGKSACDIGFVAQNPENQTVTDKVWREMAFGLENMGLKNSEIKRTIGEMAAFFGIEHWYHKKTSELSGGQKQTLALACVMAMKPKILLLDEPTSQLDPIAAADFLSILERLNKEMSLTIILVEHRLERVLPMADKVIVMENGRVKFCSDAQDICTKLKGHTLIHALPSAARIHASLNSTVPCPLTVKQGQVFLETNYKNTVDTLPQITYTLPTTKAVQCKEVSFRYEKNLPDTIKNLNLTVFEGEIFFILGSNGAGKTTLLRLLSALQKPYKGKIKIFDRKITDYKGGTLYKNMVALLPQNPQEVFIESTIETDFLAFCLSIGYSKEEAARETEEILKKMAILHLKDRHPYDLSGGEQQKCAIGKLMLLKPKILLLDEPTKGIDAYAKKSLSLLLQKLKEDKVTVIAVSHDIEFAAENADRCALLFDGDIVSADTPQKFFSDNHFYTTAASKISRNMYKNAITVADVVALCSKEENRGE